MRYVNLCSFIIPLSLLCSDASSASEDTELTILNAGSHLYACVGDIVSMHVESADAIDSYTWFLNEALISTDEVLSYIPDTPGEFDFYCTITSGTDSETVLMYSLSADYFPVITSELETQQILLCYGETLNLEMPADTFTTYTWIMTNVETSYQYMFKTGYPSQSVVAVNELHEGQYTCYVNIINGCGSVEEMFVVADVVVSNIPAPVINEGGEWLSVADIYNNYQWYVDGITIGENNDSLLLGESGTYYVVVSNNEGCSKTSNLVFYAGNEEHPNDVQSLPYPNPTTGSFYLDIDASISHTTLTDIAEKKIDLLYKKTGARIAFDLSKYPRGLYLLSITTVAGSTHFFRVMHE